jgi:RHS repeat-associated protein
MKATAWTVLRALLALVCACAFAGTADAANSSAFVSQNVPTGMLPGQTYAASVTMKNTGTTTWTTATAYHLGSQNPQDNSTWGTPRVLLPTGVSVAPGANVTFSFNVTAPNTAGTYNFQWRMVQDGVEWFGVNTTNFTVKVGINDAAFVSQNVPTVMAPGQTYAVSVTLQNSGGTTWTPGAAYKLGSQNPQDNTTWGTNRVYLPAGTSVAPGSSVTISFSVTAPNTAGTYNFQWKMVQDNVGWFGANSLNLSVKVGLNDAHFISQNVPTVMNPGQTYAVSVTMQNTGGRTWSQATSHRLGSQNTQDNTIWGMNRVQLTGAVASGASVTIAFNVTAPAAAGTYNFQWKMVQDSVEWFGELSANVAVRVGLDNAQFVSQDVPTVVVPGQSYPVSVTMRNTGSSSWSASTLGLGSQNPQDNANWGLSRVPLASTVAPGATTTFAFNITAPSASGTYNFQWRVVDSSIGWFGDATPNVAVQNGVNDAQFVAQNVPTSMNPGQTYPVSVTFQNTGTTTWTTANGYRLGSQNPQDNTTWGLSRVDLPNSVAPGASVTINFNVTAPAASGPHNFQWGMVHGASEWFGSSTANVVVTVVSASENMYFVQVDHLNTPRLIADQSGNTVWRNDNTEPFGDSVPNGDPSNTGTMFDFPLGLSGYDRDHETGTFYAKLRDAYDPVTGRFLESDPIGLRGGINTYLYVRSNPLGFIDPYGLIAWPVGVPFPRPAPPVPGPGGSPGGQASGSGLPPELDPNQPRPRTFPEIRMPPFRPSSPPPEGSRGCEGILEGCLKGANVCPGGPIRLTVTGLCIALYIACKAITAPWDPPPTFPSP